MRHAEQQAERLEGYLIALANMDEFIRSSGSPVTGRRPRFSCRLTNSLLRRSRSSAYRFGNEQRLVNGRYALSDYQIDQILELRLYQLTGLERDKILKEYQALILLIEDLRDILAREARVLTIIKEELLAIKEKYGDERRTDIVPNEGEMTIEDLIANEGAIITLSHRGLIKRTNVDSYRSQRRGGRGVIGVTMGETSTIDDEDFIEHLFTASTHDYLMFFTTLGRVYVERVHEIPEMGRAAKGKNIANLLELRPDEKVAAMIRIEARRDAKGNDTTWLTQDYLFFCTQKGTVKKTPLEEFQKVRKGGIIAIGIDPDDRLIEVKLTNGASEVVIITHEGMSIRFGEEDVRSMGRPAAGSPWHLPR